MAGQHLTYRVEQRQDGGWYWELIGQRGTIITQGMAPTENQAQVDAIRAGWRELDSEPTGRIQKTQKKH